MDARDLLAQAERLQISVFAEGDRLVVRPVQKLPPELRQQLVDLKPEILKVAPRRRWRVTPPGREPFGVDCLVAPVTPDEVRGVWSGAVVEPAS